VNGEIGYAVYETPPPLTTAEFMAEVEGSVLPVYRSVSRN
jgi:hypothetical protein